MRAPPAKYNLAIPVPADYKSAIPIFAGNPFSIIQTTCAA